MSNKSPNENEHNPSSPFSPVPNPKSIRDGIREEGKGGLLGGKNLEDDHYCFVCGEKNPSGLHLKFSIHNGKVFTEFILQKIHQGYKDIIHGGLISTILDEAMVKAALMQGMPAVTAEITVRFKNPLMAGEKTIVEAVIVKMNKKIIETSAIVKKEDNTVIAEGYAKLLKQA